MIKVIYRVVVNTTCHFQEFMTTRGGTLRTVHRSVHGSFGIDSTKKPEENFSMKVYIIDEGEQYTILQYTDRVLRVNSKIPYYKPDMVEERAKSRKNLFALEHFDCSGKAAKDVVSVSVTENTRA